MAFSNVTDLTSLCHHKHKTNNRLGCLGGSKKSSRGEVRRDIGSISGRGVEKRQNMKLKRYIEKINKQENYCEQVMTDGHTHAHSLTQTVQTSL